MTSQDNEFDPMEMKQGQMLTSMCLMCKHLTIRKGIWTCPAFPRSVPDEIRYGEPPDMVPDTHRKPHYLQDNDVVFEPDEGVTDEMVQGWDQERKELLANFDMVDFPSDYTGLYW